MTSSILCDRCGFACDFLLLVIWWNSIKPVMWCPACVDEEWEE